MLALALETSARGASVALQGPDGVQRCGQLDDQRPHVSDLLPLAASLFREAGLAPQALTHVFVGVGPGSYTGLRVGVATALGLAVGPAPPLLFGIPSPEALLWTALREGEAGVWLSDARAGTWYRSAAVRAGHFQVTTQPELVGDNALAPSELLFTDAPSVERLVALLGDRQLAEPKVAAPKASDVLGLGLERLAAGLARSLPSELAPLYLREFAAKVRSR